MINECKTILVHIKIAQYIIIIILNISSHRLVSAEVATSCCLFLTVEFTDIVRCGECIVCPWLHL